MAVSWAFWLYMAAAVAVWGGLALGAESIHEEFLEPSLAAQNLDTQREAGGNLIVLTATIVGIGSAAAGFLLSRARLRDRFGGAAGLLASSYILTILVQSAWPNVDTCTSEDNLCDSLTFSINAIAANHAALPSVLLPIVGAVAATLLGGWLSLRALFPPDGSRLPSPDQFLARVVGSGMLAAPFLAVAMWGNLRLLLAIPDDTGGLGGYLVVLPALTLVCAGALAMLGMQAWHWGSFVRNGRLGATVEEVWRGTGRALWGIGIAIAGLAAFGTLLPATPLDELMVGRTFGVTTRGHTQFMLLLLVPLAPLLSLQRTGLAVLDEHRGHHPSLEVSGLHALVGQLLVSAGLAVVAVGFATYFLKGAMWAWLAAFLPFAIVALRLPARDAAAVQLLCAFTMWAIGNTVSGSFESDTSRLDLAVRTGSLALWRLAAAIVASTCAYRLVRSAAPDLVGRATWAGIAGALGLGALLLLELPLAAWVVTRAEGQSVAIGSLLSSQDPAVQATMHGLAAILVAAGAHGLALAVRPDWFKRKARPVAAPRRMASAA